MTDNYGKVFDAHGVSEWAISNHLITDADVVLITTTDGVRDTVSLKEVASLVHKAEEEKKQEFAKRKQAEEEKAMGTLAVALSGAAAIAAKSPVVTRRFWRFR